MTCINCNKEDIITYNNVEIKKHTFGDISICSNVCFNNWLVKMENLIKEEEEK